MRENSMARAAGGSLWRTFKGGAVAVGGGTARLGVSIGHRSVLCRLPPIGRMRIAGMAERTGDTGSAAAQVGAVTALALRCAVVQCCRNILAVSRKIFPSIGMRKSGVTQCTGDTGESPFEITPVALGSTSSSAVGHHLGPMIGGIQPVGRVRILGMALKTADAAPPALIILSVTADAQYFSISLGNLSMSVGRGESG